MTIMSGTNVDRKELLVFDFMAFCQCVYLCHREEIRLTQHQVYKSNIVLIHFA